MITLMFQSQLLRFHSSHPSVLEQPTTLGEIICSKAISLTPIINIGIQVLWLAWGYSTVLEGLKLPTEDMIVLAVFWTMRKENMRVFQVQRTIGSISIQVAFKDPAKWPKSYAIILSTHRSS